MEESLTQGMTPKSSNLGQQDRAESARADGLPEGRQIELTVIASIEEVHDQPDQHPCSCRQLRMDIERHDHASADNHSKDGNQRDKRSSERASQSRLGAAHNPNANANQNKGEERTD